MHCYWKNSPNSPKPLHVHDECKSVDVTRFIDNGWEVHIDGCHHPGTPATPSDPGFRPPIIMDLARGNHG